MLNFGLKLVAIVSVAMIGFHSAGSVFCAKLQGDSPLLEEQLDLCQTLASGNKSVNDILTLRSEDNLALVKVVGVIRLVLESGEHKLIDLKPKSVEWTRGDNFVRLILRDDCLDLNLKFFKNETERKYQFAEWSVDSKPLGGKIARMILVPSLAKIQFDYAAYYSCDCMTRFYDYRAEGKYRGEPLAMVFLEFNSLEIELDGDPELIKNEIFSKNKDYCPGCRASRIDESGSRD